MSLVDRLSPRVLARLGGALYLLNIVFGAFAIGFAGVDAERWVIARDELDRPGGHPCTCGR